MKKLLFFLVVILPELAFTQNVDYNSIIIPKEVDDITFEEKLVRLAWQNNPANKILEYQQNMEVIDTKLAKWAWLDNFRVQGNLNEFVLNESADIDNRAAFFPKYNLTGQVAVGYFVNIPLQVRREQQELLIANANTNLQKLDIRAEVLTRYETYLMNRQILKIQTEITEDMYASLTLAEQRFKNGELSLGEYNNEQDRYNNQLMNQVTAQSNFNISKIRVEELIGMRLEDIQ